MSTSYHTNPGNSTTAALLSLAVVAVLTSAGCGMASYGQNAEGVRMYQQGHYPAAMQQFQKSLATDPANPDTYYNLAATLHKMGAANGDQQMLTQAESLYNQCLDLSEDHADCRRALAVLLAETGRSDRAFALMKNWVQARPDLADARVELARLYEEYGDRETAKLQLQQALQIDQYNSRAWAALGRLREQSGDIDQALANYQRSYNLNNLQPAVAERIATLNRAAVSGGIGTVGDGRTRLVTPQQAPTRY